MSFSGFIRIVWILAVTASLGLWAEEADPGALYEEANAIMGAYRQDKATTEEYAAAIVKLEHALNVLEKNGKGSTDLATEIASALFWAGKMSNINVTRAVEKLRAQGGVVPPSRFAKAGAKSSEPGEAVMTTEDKQAKALKDFQAAKEYAAKKKGDDMAIAQRWFLVAGENTESNVGMLAMVQARDALLHYANQSGKIDPPPEDGPDKDYILKGDAFMADGKFKDGVDSYLTGIQKKDTPLGRRHLARAYFNQAQKVREEVLAAHAELVPKLEDAKSKAYVMVGKQRQFNPNDPNLMRYTQQYQALIRRATDSRSHFNAAKREFELVLRAMPDKKDLEASAYIALCQRGIEQNAEAKRSLDVLEKSYEPKNAYEQLLYQYGKIEKEHLTGN